MASSSFPTTRLRKTCIIVWTEQPSLELSEVSNSTGRLMERANLLKQHQLQLLRRIPSGNNTVHNHKLKVLMWTTNGVHRCNHLLNNNTTTSWQISLAQLDRMQVLTTKSTLAISILRSQTQFWWTISPRNIHQCMKPRSSSTCKRGNLKDMDFCVLHPQNKLRMRLLLCRASSSFQGKSDSTMPPSGGPQATIQTATSHLPQVLPANLWVTVAKVVIRAKWVLAATYKANQIITEPQAILSKVVCIPACRQVILQWASSITTVTRFLNSAELLT